MPFPDGEGLRAAVERSIHDGLGAGDGSWFAQAPMGELEFRPGAEFWVTQSLDASGGLVERSFRFRVRVELVEEVDGAV